MRALFCGGGLFLLVVCAAPGARAQKANAGLPLVEWSAGRTLAIADFKGKISPSGNESSRSWVAIEASWECQDGQGSSRARAVFDPNRSWWSEAAPRLWQNIDDAARLPPQEDGGRALLAHEQLHFDMTEVWARRVRAAFKTLPAACKTRDGSKGVEKIVADLEHDWQEEQQRYDKETDHGTGAGRQRAWAQKIAKALREN